MLISVLALTAATGFAQSVDLRLYVERTVKEGGCWDIRWIKFYSDEACTTEMAITNDQWLHSNQAWRGFDGETTACSADCCMLGCAFDGDLNTRWGGRPVDSSTGDISTWIGASGLEGVKCVKLAPQDHQTCRPETEVRVEVRADDSYDWNLVQSEPANTLTYSGWTLDCANTPNGDAVEDICGVCGGNGTGCRAACPTESEDNSSLVPFIGVDNSGFSVGGKLVVALEFDHRIDYNTCFIKDVGTAGDETNRWSKNDGLTSTNVCNDVYENDYAWNDLRGVLNLKDVSNANLPDGDNSEKYRYEGVVVCKYTETFTQADLNIEYTRNAEHEMDFFINIPHEITAEVSMTQRLSQPTEQVEVCENGGSAYEWSLDAATNHDDNVARVESALANIAIVSTSVVGGAFVVRATPICSAVFATDDTRPRGQLDLTEITAAKVAEIDNFLLVNGAAACGTTECIFFTPEAIITNTESDAYRDELTVTLLVTTVVETPWYFAETAAVDTNTAIDAPISITRTTDCAEGALGDQCYQTWTIVMEADNFCGIVEDVPITITYTPLVQANVQSTEWDDEIDPISVTLAVLADTFQCSLELAEGEITATAAMSIYRNADYEADDKDEKTIWRTSETPYFRVEVDTTQALLIETTELVELTLTQGTDVTNIVKNYAAVEPINLAEGRQGRQDIVNTPYTKLAGSARNVDFSVNLDLDLFKPFDNLDPVPISWEVLIEITYEDLQAAAAADDNDRRRRRLLTADAPKRPTLGAFASKESWMWPREEDLVIEVTVEADARTEESDSSEEVVEGDSQIVVYVLAAVCVMAIGVAVYVLRMVKSIKQENIRAELNVNVYKPASKDVM